MALFGKKTQRILGVDIGSSSIKLVEIEHIDKEAHLKTYAFISDVSKVISSNAEDSVNEIARILKAIHKQSGAQSIDAVAALPNYSVFSSILTLPYMEKKKLEVEVRNEAKKLIPKSIDDMIIDWKVIEDKDKKEQSDAEVFTNGPGKKKQEKGEEKKPKFLRVLLTATSRDLVKKYAAIFKRAGLNLLSLETEPFALSRSLLGKDPSTVIFVDMGGLTTDVALVSEGIPLMSRSINVGGNIFTSAISRHTGLNQEEAEKFKIHLSYYPRAFVMPQVLKDAAAPTLNELKYTLDLFRTRTRKSPEKVILTGEASLVPGLDHYFEQQLQVKVLVGDPFHRLQYPKGIDALLDVIGSRFSVAIGLALRGFETNKQS